MSFAKWCLAAAAAAAFSAAPSWASGIEQLSEFLKSTQSASGSFVQENSGRNGSAKKNFSGTFVFKRPGKFVWSYDKPYKQDIYSNGRQVSVWDPDLRQVTVRSVVGAMPASPAAILFGNNDFRRDFTVKELAAEDGAEWIEAVPKNKDSSFRDFRIGFRVAMPVAMVMHDSFGQTLSLKFSGWKKNPAVAPARFEFKPPRGTEILKE